MSNKTLIPTGGDQATTAAASPNPNPAVKKRRNLPGNPAPDAEVIALSPTSLMATNRFVCEVCNKGFQREQNLQLHRRGHNLPWKLNKRPVIVTSTNNEEEVVEMVVVRKKVYVCPEEGCVHHQASRALGDLTGIKKHFSRKHGEKKFKCEKCSKKYAVHSDWKAHSKTCGTREYKCDCGTIFSRRDSFVTHRAFCDALAEESSKPVINPNPNINLFTPQPSPSLNSNTMPIISHDIHHQLSMKTDQNNFNMRILQTQPAWTNYSSFLNNIILNPLPFSFPSSLLPSSSSSSSSSSTSCHLSATALLQKAAEMGATMSSSSGPSISQMATHHHSPTSSPSLLQEMMMMMSSSTTTSSLSAVTPGFSNDNNINDQVEVLKSDQGLTRDFLGLKALSHADIFSTGSLHYDKMS